MKKLHSASEDMISYIKNYAKARECRKKNTSDINIHIQNKIDIFIKKIHALEDKIAQYEQQRAEALCEVLECLSPNGPRIDLLPMYQKLYKQVSSL